MGKCQGFMLSLCRQTDRQTDRQKDNGKTICPDLSIRGIKNTKKLGNFTSIHVGLFLL